MFLAYNCDQNNYGFIDNSGNYTEYAPDEMYDLFTDVISSNRKQHILWVFGLNYIAERICYILWHMGYNDMTGESTPIKKWKVRDFDYVISNDGKAFRFRIKTFDKSTLYIYNANNILGNEGEQISSDFGNKDCAYCTKNLTFAVENALSSLGCCRQKKTPYTISMVAGAEWRKLDDIPFNCEDLIDCKSVEAPGGDFNTLDDYIRDSYKGGFNYLNLENACGILSDGIVLDVNSLYPFIMNTKPIPWGEPVPFKDKIPATAMDERHYYFVRISAKFNLKEGFLPFLTIRNNKLYRHGEALTTSDYIAPDGRRSSSFIDDDGNLVEIKPEFVLSRTEYELFHQVYDVQDEQILDGVLFRTVRSAFRQTVMHHYNGKLSAEKQGKNSERRIHKMIMNALAGTLAKEASHVSVKISYDDNGYINCEDFVTMSQSKSYIHMASAILSYARAYIYELAQNNKERFIYSDTDSLHLKGIDIPTGINIGEGLGQFKVEKKFYRAIYIKRKAYIMVSNDGTTHFTVAGLTKEFREYLDLLLTTINKYDRNTSKYSLDMTVGLAMFYSNIDRGIRYNKGKAFERDNRRQNEQEYEFVYNKYYINLRKFERALCECGSVESRLGFLLNSKLPNGIRVVDDFGTHLEHQWWTRR